MNVVVNLCRLKLPRLERYWVKLSVLIVLGQDCSLGKIRGICLNNAFFGQIEVSKNRCCSKPFLKRFEGLFYFGYPTQVLFLTLC
jgi:hypothetical protein